MEESSSASDPTRPATDGQYVVIARRYRPKTFAELIGQQHVSQALGNAIETGRVGHAYLFTGARGVGKTSAARILAKALNCEKGPSPEPCNQCDVCQGVTAGEDVDVLEIDGASNRGIDEIRQLRQNANVRPSRSRFKIYIIDEVHMLTKEAFNALLKTLEEPPAHVKFIFATTEPNKIPITILSRCQRFDFAGITTLAIEEQLKNIATTEGVEAEEEALQMLARRAGGSMRDSQSLLEQLLSISNGRITADDVSAMLGAAPASRLQAMVDAMADHDAATALKELDEAVNGGTEPSQVIDQLIGYFRDVMAASVGCLAQNYLNVTPSQYESIAALANRLGIETILAIIQVMEQASGQMRSSTHSRTLAEIALVRVANLENLDELSTLIAQLQSGTAAPATAIKKKSPVAERPAERPAAKPVAAPQSKTETPAAAATQAATASPTSGDGSGSADAPSKRIDPAVELPPSIQFQAALSDATASEIWKHVVDNLGEMVADQAALSDSIAISGPNRLVVRFPAKYTSCSRFCERPEQKAKLQAALGVASGEPVQLEFQVAEQPTDQPAVRTSRSGSIRKYQAEAIKRPIVQRALELFEVDNPRVDPPPEQ